MERQVALPDLTAHILRCKHTLRIMSSSNKNKIFRHVHLTCRKCKGEKNISYLFVGIFWGQFFLQMKNDYFVSKFRAKHRFIWLDVLCVKAALALFANLTYNSIVDQKSLKYFSILIIHNILVDKMMFLCWSNFGWLGKETSQNKMTRSQVHSLIW